MKTLVLAACMVALLLCALSVEAERSTALSGLSRQNLMRVLLETRKKDKNKGKPKKPRPTEPAPGDDEGDDEGDDGKSKGGVPGMLQELMGMVEEMMGGMGEGPPGGPPGGPPEDRFGMLMELCGEGPPPDGEAPPPGDGTGDGTPPAEKRDEGTGTGTGTSTGTATGTGTGTGTGTATGTGTGTGTGGGEGDALAALLCPIFNEFQDAIHQLKDAGKLCQFSDEITEEDILACAESISTAIGDALAAEGGDAKDMMKGVGDAILELQDRVREMLESQVPPQEEPEPDPAEVRELRMLMKALLAEN